jgi:hypothetical protein
MEVAANMLAPSDHKWLSQRLRRQFSGIHKFNMLQYITEAVGRLHKMPSGHVFPLTAYGIPSSVRWSAPERGPSLSSHADFDQLRQFSSLA